MLCWIALFFKEIRFLWTAGAFPQRSPGLHTNTLNFHVLASFLCTNQVNGVHVFARGLVLLSGRRAVCLELECAVLCWEAGLRSDGTPKPMQQVFFFLTCCYFLGCHFCFWKESSKKNAIKVVLGMSSLNCHCLWWMVRKQCQCVMKTRGIPVEVSRLPPSCECQFDVSLLPISAGALETCRNFLVADNDRRISWS